MISNYSIFMVPGNYGRDQMSVKDWFLETLSILLVSKYWIVIGICPLCKESKSGVCTVNPDTFKCKDCSPFIYKAVSKIKRGA